MRFVLGGHLMAFVLAQAADDQLGEGTHGERTDAPGSGLNNGMAAVDSSSEKMQHCSQIHLL